MASATILTIGNELVSGDVANTNGSWLAKRLERLGVRVRLLAALPDEIETVAEELRGERPIGSWRRRYRTTESRIVSVLEQMTERHPEVLVGSYPSFSSAGSEVEVVVKSNDPEALASAVEWLSHALEQATQES